jgi:hypothetical protein
MQTQLPFFPASTKLINSTVGFREQDGTVFYGAGHFFERKERRGQCYKMTPEKIVSIQKELNQGLSIYRTALNHDVSEAAIIYHINNGNLK